MNFNYSFLHRLKEKAKRLKRRLKNIYTSITFNENIDPFKNHIQKTKSYWVNASEWHNETQSSKSLTISDYYLEKFNVKYEDIIGKEIEEFVSDDDFYVLELGCSKGQFMFYLNEKLINNFKPAKKYFGIEINQESCDQANNQSMNLGYGNFTFNSNYKLNDVLDLLDLKKDNPLLIISIRTLECFEDHDFNEFIKSTERIMKGLLICSENAYTSNKLVNHFGETKTNVYINNERKQGHRLTITKIN